MHNPISYSPNFAITLSRISKSRNISILGNLRRTSEKIIPHHQNEKKRKTSIKPEKKKIQDDDADIGSQFQQKKRSHHFLVTIMSVEVRKRPSETLSLASKRRATVQSTNPKDDSGLSQCYKTVTTSLYVSLAPVHLQNPINGIKQQHLDPLIMTYFAKAKGVVVAYSNIRFLEENDESSHSLAKIEGSSPFTFMWISVDFLCWCPQVGDVLEADVYMQTPSHIGLLINDTFNASIKKYNIPTSWTFKSNQVDEVSSDDKKTFGHWLDENETKIEGKLQFTVKAIYTTGRVVSVEGTLIKPGEERNAQPVYTERQERKPSGKHMKFDDDEDDQQENVITTEIAEPDENEELPAYVKDSDDDEDEGEDGKVVNKSDSEEDIVESD